MFRSQSSKVKYADSGKPSTLAGLTMIEMKRIATMLSIWIIRDDVGVFFFFRTG